MTPKTRIHNRLLAFLLLSTMILSLCGVTGCSFGKNVNSPEAKASQEAFETFLNEEFSSSFENELVNLHYTLKDPESYGIEKPEKAFSDITSDYSELYKEDLTKTKNALAEINLNHLTDEQERIYRTLEKYLSQQIELCNYPQFMNLLSYGTGLSSNLPLTLAEYAFYTEEDVKDYLAILLEVPSLLNQAYEWELQLANEGYSMAGFEIEDTIEQIDTFLDASETNLLIETFETRLNSLSGLSEDQKNSYLQNNSALVTDTVIPAFTQLKSNLTALMANAPEGKGLCHYEGGLEYYELLLKSMTLSDRSISTMINSLENRMEDLMERITKSVMADPDVYNIFASAAEGINFTNETPQEMLNQLKVAMKEDYPELADVTYSVQPIPEALKNDTTAAYYLIPPLDSPEQNRIYYGDVTEDSASLFMTLAHEGYPGHLYHQNYLLQNGLDPIFYVLDMTGYKEGWAFYVQIDTADYCDFGEYDAESHDSLTELYRCNLEYSYLLSSLVDLYVNGEGYTKEDILEYITSLGLDEETAITMYEYAVEEPGTYLQYYIGYLEILTIRQASEKKLGNKFDEKEFHTALLDLGPCYYGDIAEYMKDFY